MNSLTSPYPTRIPLIQAYPYVFGYIPVNTERRVVFPAPLGPNNPKIYLS